MKKKTKRPHRSSQKDAMGHAHTPTLFSHLLKSVPATLGIGATLLLLLSAIAYFQADPGKWILPFGLLAAAGTALIGGILIARLHKSGALICGLLNGSIVLAFLMLLSLFFARHATGHAWWLALLLHLGFLILSVIGAFCGLPRAHTPKKKRLHL